MSESRKRERAVEPCRQRVHAFDAPFTYDIEPTKLSRAKLVATSLIARPRPTVVSHEGSWASEARSYFVRRTRAAASGHIACSK